MLERNIEIPQGIALGKAFQLVKEPECGAI
jgi:hypothetical protein